MGIAILKGQQPGTAEVSTQQGFPLAVEKARIASLCRTLQALLPMLKLHPLTAPTQLAMHQVRYKDKEKKQEREKWTEE